MQYWNYLDRSEDDEQAEETALGEVQSDFDGASSGQLRETNPNQQFFDFGETLNPRFDQLDEMSGFEEANADPSENPAVPEESEGPDDGRRSENDLGGRNPLDREGQ